MTEFITRVCHGESRYEVIIKTDNEDHCKAAEDFARILIGHEKPQTNADRIRAMSDKELAVFMADKVPHGDCCDCRLGCIWADKGEFESSCQNAWYEWLMLPADQDENVDLPKVGKWVFWDGWASNHDLRIEDAVCSECGYRHPTVRLEEGYPTVEEARAAVLGKLAKECPRCGAKMIGGAESCARDMVITRLGRAV